jgi:hypothetical protein
VKLALDVPQNDLPAFRTGLSVSFTVDGKPRTATVSRLYPSLSRARLVRAEVALEGVDAADLSLGTSVDVSVVFRRQENATLVPVDALAENGRAEMRVFVVRDGVLEARQVTVLGVSCEAAAVSGVAAGKAVHLLLA